MKNIFLLNLLLIVLISFSCDNTSEKECQKKCNAHNDSLKQVNISDQLVMSVLWFEYSAEMQACYYQTFNLGKSILKENLDAYKGKLKKAVVVDIDETVLNNTPFEEKIIETGVLFNDSLWRIWTYQSKAKALPGAVEFLKYAESIGVEVFYITNRDEDEISYTKQNLINEGFPYCDDEHLLFRANKQSDKTERRNKISENYEILLLVGDNLRDFDEVFKQRENNLGFDKVVENKDLFGKKYLILPNPMYGEWEKALYGGKFPDTDEQTNEIRKSYIKSGY